MTDVLHAPATPLDAIPGIVADVRAAFASGRTRPLAWRQAQLDGLIGLLVTHEAELLEALSTDLAKPPVEAYLGDVGIILGELVLMKQELAGWLAPEPVPTTPATGPGRSEVLRQPYGVALVIAPWNYPLQLALLPVAGALAAGNTVVLKPSELAPACSRVLAELLPRYVDGLAVVEGGAAETAALLDHRMDVIFYTGGGRVGRLVMAAAARHLTPVTLELGGKSPTIVDRSADLDLAATRIAWGKYMNAGQTCIAPDYVLVDRSVEQPFLDRLVAALRAFYGPDPKASADYGRIVSRHHAERLRGLLDGLPDDAVVVGGEVDVAARYVAPTVLRGVTADAAVMQEEIFGPILPVIAVDGIDEAVAYVQRGEEPLALYVFAEDPTVVDDVLARTISGGACVNGAVSQVLNPFLPFGGVGRSGIGAYHGRASVEAFSHRRSVLWRDTATDAGSLYPPYPPLAALKQAMAGGPAS